MLRTLRMALRDLTLQLLSSRRWELFWEPEPAESDWWDKVGGGGGSSGGRGPACTLLPSHGLFFNLPRAAAGIQPLPCLPVVAHPRGAHALKHTHTH